MTVLAAFRWRCERCLYEGVVRTDADEGVYAVRNEIAARHARCSASCAATFGLAHVSVALAPDLSRATPTDQSAGVVPDTDGGAS
jgi:hypothetical protein